MLYPKFRRQVGLLGRFIGVREPNLKYLGLENMVRLAEVPAVMETVSKCAPPCLPAITARSPDPATHEMGLFGISVVRFCCVRGRDACCVQQASLHASPCVMMRGSCTSNDRHEAGSTALDPDTLTLTRHLTATAGTRRRS